MDNQGQGIIGQALGKIRNYDAAVPKRRVQRAIRVIARQSDVAIPLVVRIKEDPLASGGDNLAIRLERDPSRLIIVGADVRRHQAAVAEGSIK